MKSMMIAQLVNVLLTVVPDNMLKSLLDSLLDKIEEAVIDSSTKLDDAIVLPLVNKIRQQLDIPDNDR